MSACPPVLECRDLSFEYHAGRSHGSRAVDRVSFTVAPGESVAILGPNGCGKSTLLQILCGRFDPGEGSVVLPGTGTRAERAARLGVVFQQPALDPHMTVLENLRETAVLFGVPSETASQRIDAALADAGITDRRDTLVKRLSGGLRRRADLCRALLHEPPLLLLDEPTTGLDPSARRGFFAALDAEAARRSLTLILTTHLMDEADRCARVLLMHEGRIVADGAPSALRQALGAHQITVADGEWRPPTEQTELWTPTAAGLVYRADDDVPSIAADLARGGVAFSLASPTLADVFETHTGAVLQPAESAS